jgi:hypothetical protein
MAKTAEITTTSVAAQRAAIFSSFETTSSADLRPKSTDERTVQYLDKLFQSEERIKAIGRQPFSIVNLNPYPLMVLSPLFEGLRVDPCPEDKQYSALVIRDVKFEVHTGTDHNWTPIDRWPVMLAREFERQYAQKGGVFIIKGDLQEMPEIEEAAEFKDKFKVAYEGLIRYAYKMKTDADTEWARPNRAGRSNVHAQHRMMVRILFKAGRIRNLPDWEDELLPTDAAEPRCVACAADLKKGAYMCSACGRISDPIAAFLDGRISETDMSLERLTRKQVEELGVSAFVAETSDEVDARRKKGLAKPLSLFERRQIELQEEERREAAKAAAAAAKAAAKAEKAETAGKEKT